MKAGPAPARARARLTPAPITLAALALAALAVPAPGGAFAAEPQPVAARRNLDPGHPAPAAATTATASDADADAAHMDQMDHMDHMDHMAAHHVSAALGPYPGTREASGTSWQPDAAPHAGLHSSGNGWELMQHALVNGVHDWQEGPRGSTQEFVSGMVMAAARREFDGLRVQLRGMLSPDPLMGPRGLPLLLATGETADGVHPLVDRQHPHNLLMELSGALARDLGPHAAVFLYGGLPAEPAFGPPAFMHRPSIADSPEPPISHHWLDSTHISFGVVTLGYVHDSLKIEASRFRGREPDQHRYSVQTGALDSTAVRLSYNPTPNLALQVSWAELISPEQLAPRADQRRWSTSLLYTRRFEEATWSSTLAFGERRSEIRWLDAAIAETSLRRGAWTLFGRAERVLNDELETPASSGSDPLPPGFGPPVHVAKLSAGAIHDWTLVPHLRAGLGALYAVNAVPAALAGSYGASRPGGAMVFLRLKLE